MGTVQEHVRELAKVGRSEMRKRIQCPVLVELARRVEPGKDFLSEPLSKPLMRATIEDPDAISTRPRIVDDAQVYLVRKRPNGAFQDRIGVGRAGTDVVLPYALISKYHAYFRLEGDLWMVSDAGSRNGTFVEDARLAPGESRPVQDRTDVRIGPYGLRFFTPEGFIELLETK